MSVYTGVFLLLILLRMACATPPLRRRVFPWALLAIFAFSAFRYEVGCDWTGYEVQFDLGGETSLTDIGGDPLWWGLVQLLQTAGLSYVSLNVASSLVFFYGIYRLSLRQTDPLGFLVLIFPVLIINLPMSGIRQATAAGILCFAFMAFTDRRPARFSILVAFAALFHSSAAIFIILWPLIAMRITLFRAIVAALLAAPATFFLAGTDAAQVATSRYVGTDVEAAGAMYRVGLLCLTGLVYLLIYRRAWEKAFPSDYSLVTLGAWIMLVLPFGLLASGVISDRLGYYLVPIQAMILSRLPEVTPRQWKRVVTVTPYVVVTSVFAVWMMYSTLFELCYVPYDTWLLGMPSTTRY